MIFQTPLFGNIFDELDLPDELWQDVDKMPLLSETTAKEPETIRHDVKPKTTTYIVCCILHYCACVRVRVCARFNSCVSVIIIIISVESA